MAQFVFRHPEDPPKKVLVRKHHLHRKIKRNILIALYLIQTSLTIWYIWKTLI